MIGLMVVAVAMAAAVAVAVKREPEKPAIAATPRSSASEQAVPEAAASAPVRGQVREAFDVADYTYLRLAAPDGAELWAAVSKSPVRVGSTVAIANAARMTDFHSASLRRTFPVIYFGNLEGAGSQAAPPGSLPPGHPQIAGHSELAGHGAMASHGASAHPTTSAPVLSAAKRVPLASGKNARTIAALFAERASLAGSRIRVQGQVVKATPVQGVSYYRLRDGSSSEPSLAELLVSSSDRAEVGDVVTFEGIVRPDADVGIGTKYPVMLHEARLDRK
jgi:hypothetical protein